MPALTAALVTVAEPDVPEIGVGPAAARVQAVGVVVAPVVPLSTCLTRVRWPPWSSFVKTQVPISLALSVRVVVCRGAPSSMVQSIESA